MPLVSPQRHASRLQSSIGGLHISFLQGKTEVEKKKTKNYLSGIHNLVRGNSLYSHPNQRIMGKKVTFFEVLKFNTDHSLTLNISKEGFDMKCKAYLV